MNRIKLVIFLLVSLFYISSFVFAEDWEYWSQYEVGGSINNNLCFKIKPELRFNNDLSNYYRHFETGLDLKSYKSFALGLYYRIIYVEKNENWKVEHRPHINAELKWKTKGCSFSDRNRLEYRIEEKKESFRYRNRFMVQFPVFLKLKIQAYLALEPFYDFRANEINKNRAYAGFNCKVVGNFNAGIFYIIEGNLKEDDWENVNILGTTLKHNF